MRRALVTLCLWTLVPAVVSACTVIAAGKKATRDGSILLSHTDCGPNSRITVVKGAQHKPGELAPVYWGHQDPSQPLDRPGEVLGHIPQVARTYTYIHSAYSHINEHQLGIAESTLSQRPELVVERGQGDQIMTIEQAQIFALQRCRKAREAVKLIGELMETYGFLPSSGDGSESLVIGDTEEAWVLEVYGVGKGWKRGGGKPGAVWAAQRIPDDGVVMIPNWSVIKTIDPKDTANFMVCKHYMSMAIERGWYDPRSGRPFVWQEAYTPLPEEFATGRFWHFAVTFKAPGAWPDRWLDPKDPSKPLNNYMQTVEPLSIYPFAHRLPARIGVEEVIAYQRSWMEGTIYDTTAQPHWLVPDGKGAMVKSPLATPFPSRDLKTLLKLTNRRPVARHRGYYGMVLQLRGWLPDAIGGRYFVYLDNPAVSPYVPLWAGQTDTDASYQTYDPAAYSDASARWTIDFVDNFANLRFQDMIQDIRKVRDGFEQGVFQRLEAVEKEAAALWPRDPEAARQLLTRFSMEVQHQVPGLYIRLREQLITKYTNNHE